MRTFIASIMAVLFMASAASACPYSGHTTAEEPIKKPIVIGS